MNAETHVATGCRLHFGLLSTDPAQGRCFGGLGVMLASPGWKIRIKFGDSTHVPSGFSQASTTFDKIVAEGETHGRIERLLRRLRQAPPFNQSLPITITVEESLPHHAGLGSGTQLAMAIVDGWAQLLGKKLFPEEVMRLSGRGARSSVGQFGYFTGGFLVDAGHDRRHEPLPFGTGSSFNTGSPFSTGSIVAREEFPAEWGWWLISPQGELGLSGEAELQAFREMSPIPRQTTDRLAALALLAILPGIRAKSFHEFAAGLDEYGRLVGSHFAAVQGSVFASPLMARLASHLQQAGLPCVVQSSWGPTVAVPVCPELESQFESAWEFWTLRQECNRFKTKAMICGTAVRML
jgi:beta-RFAP synthase